MTLIILSFEGRTSALTDLGRDIVPYLDWTTHPRFSLALLQITCASSLFLLMIAPYLPWRLIAFILGESVFICSHPFCANALLELTSQMAAKKPAARNVLERLLRDDALSEDIIDRAGLIDQSVVWQIERRDKESAAWSGKTWLPSTTLSEIKRPAIEREAPPGCVWIANEDWNLDFVKSCDEGAFLFSL